MEKRDIIECDVAIIGAGPAGLSAAISLKQRTADLHVIVLEKGSEVGAHILSGAVIDPVALDELLPQWREDSQCPIRTEVQEDHFLYLTAKKSYRLPTPPPMRNEGNYIVSLGNVCRWLADIATNLGVEIYPGFAAVEAIIEEGKVKGVITGDMGVDSTATPKDTYQQGIAIRASYTLIAEGCRGSLAKQLIAHYELNKQSEPQTYGLGIKELWEIDPEKHRLGSVTHSVGWPLRHDTYGGSFIYHLEDNQVAVGYVVGLDYENPYLSPYQEFQRFKTHPDIYPLFEGGKRIAYGARALNEGGYQSIPKLIFKGGALIGCSAGLLNVPRIKGTHTAMKSAIEVAATITEQLAESNPDPLLSGYPEKLRHSWLHKELYTTRNIRPSFQMGLWGGLLYSAFDYYLLRGRAPWTFHHRADHASLAKAAYCKPIDYPKPDGKVTFDLLSSVFLSNTNHEENQPCHLTLTDPDKAISVNLESYDSPESRYCPAGVYEIIHDEDAPRLQINAQNCIHCKTCDIKDPTQNIQWIPPEGGGGPNYPNM